MGALWLAGSAALAAPGRSAPGESVEERELRALDLLVRAGRAFQHRQYARAGELYRAAWAVDPANGQPLVLAGVAAYEAGQHVPARRDLEQALQRRLSDADRDLARTYLDLMSGSPTPASLVAQAEEEDEDEPVWLPSIATSLGAGYDSNARQVSRALDADVLSLRTAGSPFASAAIELGLGRRLGKNAELDLRYNVDQRAQLDRALAELDSLEHEAAVELAQRLGRLARLSLAATGNLSFVGLFTRLYPFQRSIRLDPQIVLGRDPVRLRLGLAGQLTSTQDPTLTYLSGRRLEVNATPTLSIAGCQAILTARLRQDVLGTARISQPPDQPCAGCFHELVVPYSNLSLGAALRVTAPLAWRLRPGLSGRWETRAYESPERTEVQRPTSREYSRGRLRRDLRLAVGASVHLRIADGVIAGLRYEESSQQTSFTAAARCQTTICPMESRPDPSYYRRALGFELIVNWL